MYPNITKENVTEQIEEILKTQNKELILDLIRNKINDSFIYGVESCTHSPEFLKLNRLPYNSQTYLKYKGL